MMLKQMVLLLCCLVALGAFVVQAAWEMDREDARKEFSKDFQKRCAEIGGVVIDYSDKRSSSVPVDYSSGLH